MGDRICALPDHLLVRILLLVPTKDAVATSILSKRWRYVWMMLPELVFKDEGKESVGWFTDKSLQLHKAPILWNLTVELGPSCPVDVDVGKWVEQAVNRSVRRLNVRLLWTAEPTSFPTSLYTCHTLVDLTLSNKILVDVTSPACLPSLLHLSLLFVVYKDENSLFMLLSGSSALTELTVKRGQDDNLKQFTIKVSSLRKLFYETARTKDKYQPIGSLVIDSPALTRLEILDAWRDFCLLENMPCLIVARLLCVRNPCHMFLRSLSSVTKMYLCWNKSMYACYNNIKFSQLVTLQFRSDIAEDYMEVMEPLMFLLQKSPKLKNIVMNS